MSAGLLLYLGLNGRGSEKLTWRNVQRSAELAFVLPGHIVVPRLDGRDQQQHHHSTNWWPHSCVIKWHESTHINVDTNIAKSAVSQR